MMDNKIKDAFLEIYADEQQKEKTKNFIRENIYKKMYEKQHTFRRKYVYSFAVCFILCIMFGGYHLYFTPTTVISIDVNPSVELDINRYNKVIGINGYNEDGMEFIKTLDVMYMNYNKAIDEIMMSETIKNCLSNNEILSVAVVKTDDDQGESILQYVKNCTQGQQNIHCYGVTSEEMYCAHSLGLSCGKYKAYLELQTLNPEITPEEIGQMTMREIKDMIDEHHSEDVHSENGHSEKGHKKAKGRHE